MLVVVSIRGEKERVRGGVREGVRRRVRGGVNKACWRG